MQSTPPIPIITVDGPSGAGKGTLSAMLANHFGWHLLDSGALYRVLAVATEHHGLSPIDEESIVPLASNLDVSFETTQSSRRIVLEGEDVTDAIRTEEVGSIASKVAALPRVREALLRRQRAFQQPPGLVADGRDMGTIVFTDAEAKIFLTASAEARAERRFNELKDKGLDVSITRLLNDIKARDERDTQRTVAPLVAAEGAFLIDSTALSIQQVFEMALEFVNSKIA